MMSESNLGEELVPRPRFASPPPKKKRLPFARKAQIPSVSGMALPRNRRVKLLVVFHGALIAILGLQYQQYTTSPPSGNAALWMAQHIFTFVVAGLLVTAFREVATGDDVGSPGSEQSVTTHAAAVPSTQKKLLSCESAAFVVSTSFGTACLSALLSLVSHGLWNSVIYQKFAGFSTHTFSMDDAVDADNCALHVLIVLGVVMGKLAGPYELVVVSMFSVCFNIINHVVVFGTLGAADVGNTITVVMFGVYFGLGMSAGLRHRRVASSSPTAVEQSQSGDPVSSAAAHGSPNDAVSAATASPPELSMLSCVTFVTTWVLYPAFAGYWGGDQQRDGSAAQWTVSNLYLGLIGSALVGFYVFLGAIEKDVGSSSSSSSNTTRPMAIFFRCALSGGVTLGVIANVPLGVPLSLTMGSLAACVVLPVHSSVRPWLADTFGATDTCDMHSTLGAPAVLGGILSIVVAVIYQVNHQDPTTVWEADPAQISIFQGVAVAITLFIATVGGWTSAHLLELIVGQV